MAKKPVDPAERQWPMIQDGVLDFKDSEEVFPVSSETDIEPEITLVGQPCSTDGLGFEIA